MHVRSCVADDHRPHAGARTGRTASSRATRTQPRLPPRSRPSRTRARLARLVFEGPSHLAATEAQMTTKKKAPRKVTAARRKTRAGADVPSLFRVNIEVGNLGQAAEFDGTLFGLEGRQQAGSRCYFTCGPVTLQVVDVS